VFLRQDSGVASFSFGVDLHVWHFLAFLAHQFFSFLTIVSATSSLREERFALIERHSCFASEIGLFVEFGMKTV
jgi:hypothetical protein